MKYKKPIHFLPFDLYQLVRQEWGIGTPTLTSYPELPGIEFEVQKIQLNFVEGAKTVEKVYPGVKNWPKEQVERPASIKDLARQKRSVQGFPVVRYGCKGNTAQCSIHYTDVALHQVPSPIIAVVNAGKETPSKMLRPYCEYREVVDTSFWIFTKDNAKRFRAILAFFHDSYSSLVQSGRYEGGAIDLLDIGDFFNQSQQTFKKESGFFTRTLIL